MSLSFQEGLSESTNLAQKKLRMEYFKAVSPDCYRLFLFPSLPPSAGSKPPLTGEKNPLSRYFGFPATKSIVQLPFFFQKNNDFWLCAKVGAMAIYLGLPLWPPLQGLGQKNQLMALYCFITYYICIFFLLLLWKKILPEAMEAL